MRKTSPVSPAIPLGARGLLGIGGGDPARSSSAANPKTEPTYGQMFGFMLDSLFMDQLHSDLEQIKLYNEHPGLRHIDTLVINPTQDVSAIARRHRNELPCSLRVLLRTVGA